MVKTSAGAGKNLRPFYVKYSKDELREALRRMQIIRKFEEGAEKMYQRLELWHHAFVGGSSGVGGGCHDDAEVVWHLPLMQAAQRQVADSGNDQLYCCAKPEVSAYYNVRQVHQIESDVAGLNVF